MKNFSAMPAHSRIWVYQSERELTSSEAELITKKAAEFIAQWTSHNQQMDACLNVLHNRFLILCVDERTAPASGCGIDKSVHFIQGLEKEYGVSLTDRMVVVYREGGNILSCRLPELKSKTSGVPGISVFNPLVQTKDEFDKSWEMPLATSWQKQWIT